MKKLLPSLREKKRYIAFEIEAEKKLGKEEIINAANDSCKSFAGEFLCGKAGFMVLDEFVNNNKGVVRVNNKYVDLFKTGLVMIRKVNGNKVIFKNARVSGNLSKLK